MYGALLWGLMFAARTVMLACVGSDDVRSGHRTADLRHTAFVRHVLRVELVAYHKTEYSPVPRFVRSVSARLARLRSPQKCLASICQDLAVCCLLLGLNLFCRFLYIRSLSTASAVHVATVCYRTPIKAALAALTRNSSVREKSVHGRTCAGMRSDTVPGGLVQGRYPPVELQPQVGQVRGIHLGWQRWQRQQVCVQGGLRGDLWRWGARTRGG